MVIDGKLFRPGNALQPNTLFVVEQIPGHVAGSDASDILAKGYWGSFNGMLTGICCVGYHVMGCAGLHYRTDTDYCVLLFVLLLLVVLYHL